MSRRTTRDRGVALPSAVLLVLLASLVLAGCAGMPTSGPVHQIGSSAVATSDQGPPNYDPLPPQQDASRAEIVRGFINAMVAIPSQTRTAKLFLTDDAAERWNPQQETITYAEPPTPRGVGGDVVVRLVGADRLDARGAWQGCRRPRAPSASPWRSRTGSGASSGPRTR